MPHPFVSQLVSFFESHHLVYRYFEHPPVKTSQEAASLRTGYSLKQGAKAIIIKIPRPFYHSDFVMLVFPADRKFDNKKVKILLNIKEFRFATPEEISFLTQGILPGAIPPFGNLFSIPLIVDPSLFENKLIIFNAGDRGVSISISSRDYRKVAAPLESVIT